MATEFVLHEVAAETGDEELGVHPIWDYTDWTFDLTVVRRSGTSPTLDVTIQSAPLDDTDEYEDLVAFDQVTGATTLPNEQSKSEDAGDYSMPAGARYVRIDQDVGGTDPEWYYLLTATVTLFDPASSEHVALLDPQVQKDSDLSDLVAQAEDDVVRQYRGSGGKLTLDADELTGRALREAIARRADWLHELDLLTSNDKQNDHLRARDHRQDEWLGVRRALSGHDSRDPVYMI